MAGIHDADLFGVNDNEEHDHNSGDDHADAGKIDNAAFAAVLADILGTKAAKMDGTMLITNQNRAKTYIADDNAENCVDDGLAADLLSQLVGCVGRNVALQRLIV